MSDPHNPYLFCKVNVISTPWEQGLLVIDPAPASSDPSPWLPAGEVGDVLLIHQPDNQPSRKLVVSLGAISKITFEILRQAGSTAVRWLAKNQIGEAVLDPTYLIDFGADDAVAAFIEGMYLGAFRFDRYKKANAKTPTQPVVHLIAGDRISQWRNKVDEIETIATSTNLARDWAHEPANIINPQTLAERVQALFQGTPVNVTVLYETQLEEMKAGAILAVGQGSKTPARMIILNYPGDQQQASSQPVILVGKALTFDSGGYSLKNTEAIVGMKYDKCGGLAVIAALQAAERLKISQPVIGIIAAAENMVSEQAYRPDDIITTLSGKTVEIITTDAEGRLVLADALTYAQSHYQPKALIDLATLTGGVVVALGHVRAGIMSNNDTLVEALTQAGEKTYERLWRLPLDEEYFKLIQGDEADIKNSGGREGHSILGGMFLKQFVEADTPWAHLDIAGMANSAKELPYCPKGATGFGVRLLVKYLQAL